MASSLIISGRFLSLIGHLVILIALFWSKDAIIANCTFTDLNQEIVSSQKNIELTVGLAFSLLLLTSEIFGHLSGLSMFVDLTGLLSIFLHVSASICLCLYWISMWNCDTFWYIFAFGRSAVQCLRGHRSSRGCPRLANSIDDMKVATAEGRLDLL